MNNKIIIVTGPSGSGKTTLTDKLLGLYNDKLDRIKTFTTRINREELDNNTYEFVSLEEFKNLIDLNKFVEYEEVYSGVFYGTSKDSILDNLYNKNKNSIICLDVQGAIKIKNILGNRCVTVFCNPQKWEIVKERLEKRGVDSNLNERLLKYNFEMTFQNNFDISIDTSENIDITIEKFQHDVLDKVNHKTLVVNLYGGPGTGKSTMAAALFSELKFKNITSELITEFAKDKVWEESLHLLNDQLYIFANQNHKMWSVLNKVDVIITDSPLIMSVAYTNPNDKTLISLVKETHFKNKNLDIFLKREKPYVQIGRIQSELEAKQKDGYIKELLHANLIKYHEFNSNSSSVNEILKLIFEKIEYEF